MDKYRSDTVDHYYSPETTSENHQDKPKHDRTWMYILQHEVDWFSVRNIVASHILALWGLYRVLVYGFVSYYSLIFTYFTAVLNGIGSLAGAHRYFSHRAYKAHWLFKLFLLFCQTSSGQRSVVRWAREHRTHHKYTGTDADCVNINRGFFFAHIGWLLIKPHPECEKRMAECNVSDLTSDPMIQFQYDYYTPLMLLCNIIIPTLIPYMYFGESLLDSFLWVFIRYVYTLHVAFAGNSVLHYFGTKPYDKRASATQSTWMMWATMGGGHHNYHHTIPYDAYASEFGPSTTFNLNTVLIELCAKVGLASDLKRASPQAIASWKQKYGDPEEEDTFPKRSAFLDWTIGMIFSATPVWLVLIGRLVVYSIQTKMSHN